MMMARMSDPPTPDAEATAYPTCATKSRELNFKPNTETQKAQHTCLREKALSPLDRQVEELSERLGARHADAPDGVAERVVAADNGRQQRVRRGGRRGRVGEDQTVGPRTPPRARRLDRLEVDLHMRGGRRRGEMEGGRVCDEGNGRKCCLTGGHSCGA